MNEWSYGKVKKIRVCDFFFDMREVKYKDKTVSLEYSLFMMMVKQWMAEGMSRTEALDLVFEMYNN